MAQHFAIRTRATRPEMRATGLNERERAAYVKHVEWLQRMVDEGVMVVVGRTEGPGSDGSDQWALGVIKAEDEAAALEIMNSDPFVTDGVAVPELFPFSLIRLEPQNA